MATITHFFKVFYPDNPYGGIQEVIHQLGLISIENGHKVNVVSLSDKPGVSSYDGINCISFKTTIGVSTMPMSYELICHFKKIVDESDIIHLHYPYPFVELLSLFCKINKPIVITYHAPIVGRNFLMTCYTPFVRRLFKKVDKIVPTSPNLLKSEQILSGFESKCQPIGLWIDDNRFKDKVEVDDSFKKQIESYGDYALFVGALRTYKGLQFLLDAAKKVNHNIVIAGKGSLFEVLNKRILKEKINNVHLLGFQNNSNVAFLFEKCKFFVLPSHTKGECFGVVLLEASYYEKPMISTELGSGTSWINIDGETGFVVPPADSSTLAEKMNILFNNKELCKIFGDNAKRRVENDFNAKILGAAYLEIYNSLL